jgi:hypothetical protein
VNREAEDALRSVAAGFSATRQDLERIALSLGESSVPRLGDFAAIATSLLDGRTRETYQHHIDRLIHTFGERRLDDISLLELEQVAAAARASAVERPTGRHGYGAQVPTL